MWVRRVEGELLEPAATRLVDSVATGDGDAGRRFLMTTKAQGVDLRCFFASVGEDGGVREAALCVPGAGRTGMFFTSQPGSSAREGELSRVIDAACGVAVGRSGRGAAIAQALLLPSEGGAERAFSGSGFTKLAKLAYLRRRARAGREEALAEPWGSAIGSERVEVSGVSVIRAVAIPASERDGRFISGLSRSYEATKDCPLLCDIRDPADVLESHQAVGELDWSLWWLIEEGGEALGAMLWNVMSRGKTPGTGGSAELVYMGVAPTLRGRGLGRGLLSYALAELQSRGVTEATCAVDLSNDAACGLYDAFGFRRFAERVAYVKKLEGNGGGGEARSA